MNFKKIASVLLVVALVAVSVVMWATSDSRYKDKLSTYESKISEYEAKIAENEAKIAEDAAKITELETSVSDLSFQLELQDYVATFDGGHVTAAEALDQYAYIEYVYQSYGYSLEGMEDDVKQNIMTSLVQSAIEQYEAQQMGLAEPDEAEAAEVMADAQATLDTYIADQRAQFEGEGKAEEDVIAETTDYLAQNGLTLDMLYEQQLKTFAQSELFAAIVKDVAVTEEDAKAHYDTLVAADQATYSTGDGYSYESAVTGGTTVYWNPEGYRTVKHVLVAFDEAQAARYAEITGRIAALESELNALTAPTAEPTAEATVAAPTATVAATATVAPTATVAATVAPSTTAAATATIEPTAEVTAEQTAAPRTAEQINADLAAANAELDALYGELAPTAAEVVDKFNAGTDIDTLITEYGKDPGMTSEPGLSKGYVVSANSAYWEAAFTQAAMAIPAVGQISEPVNASNGIHVIYYLADVTPGAVDYDSVKDAVSGELLDTKQSEVYDAQIQTWMTELNVQYYIENFR